MADTGFIINQKAYNILKWIALIFLPALATALIALGVLLNWGEAQTAAGVVTIVDTFLGALLKKSSTNNAKDKNYGNLIFQQDPKDGSVQLGRVEVTKENPIFPVGEKITFTVNREQMPQ